MADEAEGSLKKELVSSVAERKHWGENWEGGEEVSGSVCGAVSNILCSLAILGRLAKG